MPFFPFFPSIFRRFPAAQRWARGARLARQTWPEDSSARFTHAWPSRQRRAAEVSSRHWFDVPADDAARPPLAAGVVARGASYTMFCCLARWSSRLG